MSNQDFTIPCTLAEIEKFIEITDYEYMIFYSIIFVVFSLVSLGFQNITLETIPKWDGFYLVLNSLIPLLAIANIYLIAAKKRISEFNFTVSIFLVFLSVTIIQTIMLLFFTIEGGIIFRISFGILGTIIILLRVFYLKLFIRKGL